MKITRLKDSVRNIKRKIVSWISIVIVIMMSVGCYLGCYFYRKSLSDMAEKFYIDNNFKDLEIISTVGISQGQIDELKNVEGIKEAEAFNLIKVAMVYKEKTRNIDFISWTDTVSKPMLQAGNKPEKEDEVAVSIVMADKLGIKIGDTIDISVEGDSAKLIKKRTFKVTALVDHADYIKCRYVNYVVAPDAAFDMESTKGRYLRAIIKAKYSKDVYPFSDEYFDVIRPLENRLEDMMDDIGLSQDAELKSSAQSELDKKKTEADDEIAKAEKKIEDGQKEYDEKIADAEKKLADARKEISGYDKTLADKEKELKTGIETLANAKETANTQIDSAKTQLENANKLLKEGKETIDSSKAALDAAENELAVAKSKLAAGKEEYAAKKQEVEEKLAAAEAKLDNAINESNAAMAQVDEFEQLLSDISSSTGIAIPQQYYDLKEKAKGLYEPYVEALVNDGDSDAAKAAADADLSVAIDEALYGGAAPLMPFIREMNVRDFFKFAQYYYGDVKVLDVLDTLNGFFINGLPGYDTIKSFIELVNPDMTISGFLSVLDVATELIGIGDARVGDLTASGEAYIKEQLGKVGMALASVDVLKDAKAKLDEKIKEANEQIAKIEAEIAEGEKKIADAEKQISEGKTKLNEGIAKFEESAKTFDETDKLLRDKTSEAEELIKEAEDKIASGRTQLADAKSKLAKYKSELEEKEEEYEKQKAEGEKKLKDARAELDEKKQEAQEKIDEAQEKIDNMEPSHFVLQNRRANEGFMDIFTVLGTIKAAANCFIIVFIIIGVLVCFSTITIIIDEQKNLVGTQKSLGFFNRAIRSKYLIYGVSAVITGIFAGILLNILLQFIFQKGIGLLYVVGLPDTIFMPGPAIGISVAEILVAVFATFAACRALLKMTAVQLMSGQASLKRVSKKKAKTKGGSTYSRLIRRNMVNDIVRVIISVVIIAASCAMIGAGFTLKFAFTGMVDNQLSDVYKYDMSVTYKTDEDEETIRKLEEAIADSGAVYSKSAYTLTIYRANDRKEYTGITILNDHTHPKYYSIIDYFTGEEMEIPDEGVLIQSRLHEITGLGPGDKMIMYSSSLAPIEVEIKGVYNNYIGRNIVMSESAYEKINGTQAIKNTLYVKRKSADVDELEKKLKHICPDITITTPETIHDSYRVLEMIYNMIVLILTGFAILMSIFVLSNLTNIFVARRKKELIVMRVNGFSTKQCIGYLSREAIATTIISFILAIIVGVFMSRIMIMFIESEYTMYERGVSVRAWIYAICLEALFTGIIDALAFRKIKNLKVTDINA